MKLCSTKDVNVRVKEPSKFPIKPPQTALLLDSCHDLFVLILTQFFGEVSRDKLILYKMIIKIRPNLSKCANEWKNICE